MRPCSGSPTCPNLVSAGRCPDCSRTYEAHRGSRIARGYDAAWLRLRAWFLQQPEHVLCRICQRAGRVTVAKEVDHIVPFVGRDDPRRLDVTNLQPLCVECHRKKTASSRSTGAPGGRKMFEEVDRRNQKGPGFCNLHHSARVDR
jgi:5-methylcytosine-specific restriction protein A